ncbi:MAG TPA: type I DNA topoisomerase [Tepidiformaceae bacterium]
MTSAATKRSAGKRSAPKKRAPRAAVEPTISNGRRDGKAARNLVIVESPAKARTVENILGDEYRVIASVGHVRDLPAYGYGVEDFETFKPKYVVVKDKKRGVDKSGVIEAIAKAAKQAERVYLSTDPDREGEAISWHIKEAAGIPDEKTTRVVFHEITKPAIERAFEEAQSPVHHTTDHRKAPGKIDMHLVDAQQTRRVLDRLIGFPLTWFVQGKVSRSASAGRVQSVALRLIVEREREIQDFQPREYWTIHALLAKGDASFAADLVRLPGQRSKPNIDSEAAANRLLEAFRRSEFTVANVKKGTRNNSPFPPFTTSTFQQAASNRLGIGAQRAMSIAQDLYEGVNLPGQGPTGLITYMRTDSLNIAHGAQDQARQFIHGRWGAEYVPEKRRAYRTRSRGAQEAHEAIRPTDPARTPESLRNVLDAQSLRVYTLIWQRFMASQMSDARYGTVSVEIDAKEGGEQRGVFRAGTQHLIFAGHLAAYGRDVNDRQVSDEDEDEDRPLPELTEGERVARRNVEGKQHFTEPPPRFTEASLVKTLEELGIGRPSTYATIVQTVQKRDYVKKEGRALVPQELGFLVNDMLVKHLDKYVAPEFTSKMEDQLDQIAGAKAEYLPVVRDFWSEFEKKIDTAKGTAVKQVEETDILCNVCEQANMVIKWGRNGKFFACPRYPECTNSLPMGPDGQPVYVEPPTETEYACPKCGSPTVRKTGPYGPYIDCVRRETKKCDFRSGVPIGVECPEEPGRGQLVEKTTRRGTFYGCWNYPNCSYTTNSLEPGKMSPARPPAEREEANRKLGERSARGKAAFATRRAKAATVRKAS